MLKFPVIDVEPHLDCAPVANRENANLPGNERVFFLRGDARPDSDADLLVIEESLPDKAQEYQRLLKVVGYENVDLILLSRADYTKRSEWVGSLPYRAAREGRVLCG